jgi:hypothetical protein
MTPCCRRAHDKLEFFEEPRFDSRWDPWHLDLQFACCMSSVDLQIDFLPRVSQALKGCLLTFEDSKLKILSMRIHIYMMLSLCAAFIDIYMHRVMVSAPIRY